LRQGWTVRKGRGRGGIGDPRPRHIGGFEQHALRPRNLEMIAIICECNGHRGHGTDQHIQPLVTVAESIGRKRPVGLAGGLGADAEIVTA